MKFADWLAEKLGTRDWVVARRTPHLAERYTMFLSRAKYTALYAEYKAARARTA